MIGSIGLITAVRIFLTSMRNFFQERFMKKDSISVKLFGMFNGIFCRRFSGSLCFKFDPKLQTMRLKFT